LLISISVGSGAQAQTGAVFVSTSDSDLEEAEDAFFLLKGVVDLALHMLLAWMI